MLYYDDIDEGQIFTSPFYKLEEDHITSFAGEYDPQAFHTDADAAKETFFGQLVASGWHTAAITMKLMVQTGMDIEGGMIGMGIDKIRWPRPTYPGDSLQVTITVKSKRLSKSRPGFGVVTVEIVTRNQNDEVAQEMMTHMWVPQRT